MPAFSPAHRCPACGAGHYAAVRFCPFCGAAQARPQPVTPPEAPPVFVAAQAEPTPRPPPAAPPPRAASPVPPVPPPPLDLPRPPAPPPGPAAPPKTQARWIRPRRRPRIRIRHAVLAILAIAVLAWLAASRRETLPPPGRVAIGPGWTAVTLAPYRAAPLLRLTADVPFSLRVDGERVTRAVPGSGTVLRPRALRSLELRSGRGQATVTLTPRAE